MVTVENQKIVSTNKEKSNKENLYSIVNLDALHHAALDLKGETFKMWCYFNKNQNGHTFALSKVDALSWGIGSKSSYDRAVAELIEKGYLVAKNPGSNHYDFYELPPKEEELIITINNTKL